MMMVDDDESLSLECDTLEEDDRCNPRCVNGKGACDEGIKFSFHSPHLLMF